MRLWRKSAPPEPAVASNAAAGARYGSEKERLKGDAQETARHRLVATGAIFVMLFFAVALRMGYVSLLRDGGTTSVPALAAALPISRQAVAKHVVALGEAGLLERAPSAGGREVHYRLRSGALDPAATWMRAAEKDWDARLKRLKANVERSGGRG